MAANSSPPSPPGAEVTHAFDRLREAEAGRSVRFAWAAVGSTWVHMGLVTLALVKCSTNHDAEVVVERPVTLVVAEFERPSLADESDRDRSESRDGEAAEDIADASADEPLRAINPDELADLDPADILATPPEAFGLMDPSALDALDPAQLEALRSLEIPQELRVALLAALEAAELQAEGREVPDLESLVAPDADVPAVVDAAAAPELDADPEVDAAGADDAALDADASVADPDDAVADAALPLESKPVERDDDLDKDEVVEVEEPPEEEEVEARKDPRWLKYLAADKRTEQRTADEGTDYISSRDSRADEQTRTAVVAQVDGVLLDPITGVPIQAGTPAMTLADGDPDGGAGDLPSSGEPVDAAHELRQGGGSRGEAPGLGAPDRGGETRGGPAARSGRRAAPALPAVVINGGAPGHDGAPEAPRGEREAAARSAAWWAPSVVRVVIPAPVTPPAEAAVSAPMHTEATHAAPLPRPDEKADEGGTERADTQDEPTPEDPIPDAEPEEGEAEEQEEVVEQHESVSDLRDALGWGGAEHRRERPKRTLPGTQTSDGNMPTSPQVADDELDLASIAFIDAAGTPLGEYREGLDADIGARWDNMHLSIDEIAMGIQGDVAVVFQVHRNGKVYNKQIVRSSGYSSIDQMALSAIPDRLPRIPKDVDDDVLTQRYNFHYRNPMITGGGAQ